MPMTPGETAKLERLERIVFGLVNRYKEQFDIEGALREALDQYEDDPLTDRDLLAMGVEPCVRPNSAELDTERRNRRAQDRVARASRRGGG